MAKYDVEFTFTDHGADVVDAADDVEAEYIIQKEYDYLQDLRITRIEEIVD